MNPVAPRSGQQLRIVKVGGSLLDWHALPETLGRWLDEQAPASNVLIAGGGTMADVVRRADATHGLGEQTSHDLCLETLGVTARLLASLTAGRAPLATWAAIRQLGACEIQLNELSTTCCVLDVRDWSLSYDAAALTPALPPTWDVTSDSISAVIAATLAADELVLLKSCEPPGIGDEQASPQFLAAAGYVDPYFPTAVRRFAGKLRFANLRGLQTP